MTKPRKTKPGEPAQRRPGQDAGKGRIAADFDAPLGALAPRKRSKNKIVHLDVELDRALERAVRREAARQNLEVEALLENVLRLVLSGMAAAGKRRQ